MRSIGGQKDTVTTLTTARLPQHLKKAPDLWSGGLSAMENILKYNMPVS